MEAFEMEAFPDIPPRYNIAPSQAVVAVRENEGTGHREAAILSWGLVPHWAREPSIGHKLLNARAETAASKPAFRSPMRHHRCLVPMNGFYEWKRAGTTRQPYFFYIPGKALFAVAGLWEHWGSPDGSEIESVTLLTTAANADMEPIHHRMPVILEPQHYARWLDTDLQRSKDVEDLLVAAPAKTLRRHVVDSCVNSPHVEGPELIQAVNEPLLPEQGELF